MLLSQPTGREIGLSVPRLLLLWLVVAPRTSVDSADAIVAAPRPCNLCIGGDNITLPEKEIEIPGFEFVRNCEALASFAPLLFQVGSEECDLLQSIGTLCGCPRKEESCDLCPDGSTARFARRKLEFLSSSFGGIVPTCEILEAGLHTFNISDPYCASSHSFFTEYCGCGAEIDDPPVIIEAERCSLCYFGEPVPFPDKTVDILGFPFETCGQLANASIALAANSPYTTPEELVGNNCFLFRIISTHCGCESPYSPRVYHSTFCTICSADDQISKAPFPDALVHKDLSQLLLGAAFQPTCGAMADIARMFSNDPNSGAQIGLCRMIQGIGVEYCGCPPQAPTCDMCSGEVPSEKLSVSLFNEAPLDQITCRVAMLVGSNLEEGAPIPLGIGATDLPFECRFFKYTGFVCGCNNGLFSYWGADTKQKQKAAIWTQRTTALLSIGGSLAIIIDTIRQKHWHKMYNQIMLCLSFFDVLSSIAWGLGSLPAPQGLAQHILGADMSIIAAEDQSFYGSHGNSTTCRMQAFLLHWGLTSIFYNICLAYFYKLSVVDGLKGFHFKWRFRLLFLTLPALLGLVIAIATMPYIKPTPAGCTFGSHNDSGGWTKIILLFYLPYGPAFVYIPAITFHIYCVVRSRMRQGDRCSLNRHASTVGLEPKRDENHGRFSMVKSLFAKSKSPSNSVEVAVFWQSFWYVVAFFSSYSIFLVVFALDGYEVDAYWFLYLVAIFAPLQGAFNSIVYFRKRLGKWNPFANLKAHLHWDGWGVNKKAFALFPALRQNDVPSANVAIQGDYGLSNIPSIFSSGLPLSTLNRRGEVANPEGDEGIEEEKEEVQEIISESETHVSATTSVTSSGIRSKQASSSVSELSTSDRQNYPIMSDIAEDTSELESTRSATCLTSQLEEVVQKRSTSKMVQEDGEE